MPTPDTPVDPRILQSLQTAHDALMSRGTLMTKGQLTDCYALFRDQFGPQRLKSLDGEELLNTMHAHGNKDSLVYWLEFKSDDEFPTRQFGSIAGGSALKFGIYKSKNSGEWMTGHPSKQYVLSLEDAIATARKHRDQLMAAAEAIQALPLGADDQAYVALQLKLDAAAPDVSRLAWGHKYLSLLFPDKIDDIHADFLQKHLLVKLLILPSPQPGLYASAGPFCRLAIQMGWPITHLTQVISERSGPPVDYWRIGSKVGDGTHAERIWPAMAADGYAAIGWAELGDLTDLLGTNKTKELVAEKLRQTYADYSPSVATRKAGEIKNFTDTMKENDIVLAADGESILGIGQVKGPYRFEPTPPEGAPHRRQVKWLTTSTWKLPVTEGLQTTVWKLRKSDENLVAIERHILDGASSPTDATINPVPPHPKPPIRNLRLEAPIPAKLQAILERKGQVILYGPPGTGKTYWGKHTAQELAAIGTFGRLYADLTGEEKAIVDGTGTNAGLLRCCTFHPAFGYEDFIEGYRPQKGTDGQLIFELRDGIFKTLCRDAAASPNQKFVLLIDEINRGDIPRIFGELLTLLEKNKRGQDLTLPLSGDRFSVPPNVLVIGTMNTADRSIALLDTALRRRFGFVELMPDSSTLSGAISGDAIPLGPWLEALNTRIREHVGKDARNLQVGHAYLMDDAGKPVTNFAKFSRIIAEDIVPLLEEYCYEDYGALAEILGTALVDSKRQRVRDELFSPARQLDLIQALLAPTPELATTAEAVAQLTEDPESEDEAEETTP